MSGPHTRPVLRNVVWQNAGPRIKTLIAQSPQFNADLVRISADLVQISADLVQISADLVQISAD